MTENTDASQRVLVLGCGMQGRAVVHDLARSSQIGQVVCADVVLGAAEACADRYGHGKAVAHQLDAAEPGALQRLLAEGFTVVVDMMPRQFIPAVVEAAMASGTHVVNTYYDYDLRERAGAIQAAGITVLPEMGMDPGIDLVLYRHALSGLEAVEELLSFGGAIPTPEADTNPLHYKISWTWEGVLNSYDRGCVQVIDGRRVTLPSERIFEAENLQPCRIDGVGLFEGTPNGDAAHYTDRLGLTGQLRKAGRYAVRWPGHGAIWDVWKKLGFLEEQPVPGLPGGICPRQFLRHHLEPRLQYASGEKDQVVIHLEAVGRHDGRRVRQSATVVDTADLETGLTATARTVGFPAAIGALFLLDGTLTTRGLLSPLEHVPVEPFIAALQARGITVQRQLDPA